MNQRHRHIKNAGICAALRAAIALPLSALACIISPHDGALCSFCDITHLAWIGISCIFCSSPSASGNENNNNGVAGGKSGSVGDGGRHRKIASAKSRGISNMGASWRIWHQRASNNGGVSNNKAKISGRRNMRWRVARAETEAKRQYETLMVNGVAGRRFCSRIAGGSAFTHDSHGARIRRVAASTRIASALKRASSRQQITWIDARCAFTRRCAYQQTSPRALSGITRISRGALAFAACLDIVFFPSLHLFSLCAPLSLHSASLHLLMHLIFPLLQRALLRSTNLQTSMAKEAAVKIKRRKRRNGGGEKRRSAAAKLAAWRRLKIVSA